MISSTNIERNIELNFPIEKVKQDIERTVKFGAYVMHSKNDILNTFRIGKATGLEVISMNVTLKSLENGSTNIHIVVSEKIRNSGHQTTIDQMIDAFLERLSNALTGASDEQLKTVSAGNKGCMVTILILFAVGAAATASAAVLFW
ncbi:MAG: hypothetical protein WCK82_02155 [Bacteroidota bacterium]